MHLFRHHPARLERLAKLHDRLPSAELVLYPPAARGHFVDTGQLQAAIARGALVPFGPKPALTSQSIRSSGESRRV
jgi:hypothetical protein